MDERYDSDFELFDPDFDLQDGDDASALGIGDDIIDISDEEESSPESGGSGSTTQDESEQIINQPVPSAQPSSILFATSTPSTSNNRRALDSPGDESAAKRPCTGSQSSSLETSTGDEGSMCTVCYDNWTTTGPHRLISLKCGHLFGNSCIERWFKNFAPRQKARCPQCNSDAKKSDIRPIYAKNIKTIDTTEKEKYEAQIQVLKKRRSEIEQALMVRDEQVRDLEEKVEKLKSELMNRESLINLMRSKANPSANPSALRNATNLPGCIPNMHSLPPAKPARFKLVSSSKIVPGGARCMATNKSLDAIAVSVQSKNPCFPGYGVIRINAHDLRPTSNDFMHIHKHIIKEMVFKPSDAILLSASFDKTLKLTSHVSKKVEITIELGDQGWSCCWNPRNTYICYAGLSKGVVLEYDIRKPSAPLNKFDGMSDKPVTSVQFVSPSPKSGVTHTPTGLIGCSLDKCYFYELNESSTLESKDYLPFHGKCLPVHFDCDSGFGLVSLRPSNNPVDGSTQTPAVCHKLFELIKESPESQVKCQLVKSYLGGSVSNVMPRSRVFMPPEPFSRDVLVFAADEQNKGFLIWDTHAPESHAQVFHTDKPVVDIDLVTLDQRMRVAALTESSIYLYEKI